MDKYLNGWLNKVLALLPNLVTAILIFIASLYLAGLLSRMLRRVLEQRKADQEVTLLLTQLTRWSIIVAGIITALQRFFNVTAFLAGLGILGFSIGFALQNILQNFAAGVILLVQQPFEVGDGIEVSNFGGTVLAVNLRTTEIKTWDGRIVILPNADVLSHPITNFTRANNRRIQLSLGVGYDSDLDLTRESILASLKNVPGYMSDPSASVVFDTFADSTINLTTYFWIDMKQAGLFDAQDAAVRLIKNTLDKHGIEMPAPIRTVYLHTEK